MFLDEIAFVGANINGTNFFNGTVMPRTLAEQTQIFSTSQAPQIAYLNSSKPIFSTANIVLTVLVVVIGVFAIAAAVAVAILLVKRRNYAANSETKFGDLELSAPSNRISIRSSRHVETKFEILKNIEIKETLGSGNFGEVFRGKKRFI
jgi:hypothetical protein